jgi:peptidoglycan/LPS O-acetylase OafA/YrhL
MTHGLFPNAILPGIWVSFLGAAWSLSTEWQFYVLALFLGRRGIGSERMAALFLMLAATGLLWDETAPEAWRFSRAFLPNKAQYFALGIASAAWIDRQSIRSFGLALAAALLLCAAHGNVEKLLPPLIWTVCLMAQRYPGGMVMLADPLRWRIVQWLGAVSYPIYLVNEPIQKALGVALAYFAAGDVTIFTAVWLPAAVLIPIGVAALLHRYIETPAQRWGRTLAAPPAYPSPGKPESTSRRSRVSKPPRHARSVR